MAGPFLASASASATLHHLLTRTHSRAYQSTQHSHSPAPSPLISSHSTAHSLAVALRRCDWLSSRTRRFVWPRPARAACRGCGFSVCVCVCVHTVTCAEVSLLCALFPRMRSHGNPFVPLLSVAFGAFQDWMSVLCSGRRGSISSSQTAVLACFDRNNEAELLRKTAGAKWE